MRREEEMTPIGNGDRDERRNLKDRSNDGMSWTDKGVPSVLREGKDEEQYR